LLKINTIFLSLIIFSLNSFAQITGEEYNREKECNIFFRDGRLTEWDEK